MIQKIYTSILAFLLLCSCEDEQLNRQQALANLDQLLNEIEVLASSTTCQDDAKWTYTAIGTKACGGPADYIAYSNEIDTSLLLDKIESYNEQQIQFFNKYGEESDCAITSPPIDVICENGEAVLVY